MTFLKDFENLIMSSEINLEREESSDSSLSIRMASEAAGYSRINNRPVFILFTIGNSPMAKGIQKLYNTTISHVCVSFNINLDPLYSFGCKSMKPFKMGFVTNSPKSPQTWGKDPTPWFLYVTYVSPKAIASMRKRLQFFISNQEKMHYSFPTLAKLFFRAKSPKGMNWVCSTFCSEILKAGGVELTKDSTQYLPQDMIDIKNVDFVIQGKDIQTDYDPKKAFQALARVRKAETVERYTFRDNKMVPIAANEAIEPAQELLLDFIMSKANEKSADKLKQNYENAKICTKEFKNHISAMKSIVTKYVHKLIKSIGYNYEDKDDYFSILSEYAHEFQYSRKFTDTRTIDITGLNKNKPGDGSYCAIVKYSLKDDTQYHSKLTMSYIQAEVKKISNLLSTYLSSKKLPGSIIFTASTLDNTTGHIVWYISNEEFSSYVNSQKITKEAIESSINTGEMNNIDLRAKFKDVLYVVNTLPKEDLYRICNGEFKDSPYVFYRKIAYSNNTPIGFVDVYCLTKELLKGYIVIAVSPQYRRSGIARLLILKLLIDFTNNPEYKQYRLIWRVDADNAASINMANNLGFRQFYKSPEKIEFDFPKNRAKKIDSEEIYNNDFAIENFIPDIENFQQIAIEGNIDVNSSFVYKDDEARAKKDRILCIVSNLNTDDFMWYADKLAFIKNISGNLTIVPFDLNNLCNVCRGYPGNFTTDKQYQMEFYIKKYSSRIVNPEKADSTLKIVAQAIELFAKENKDCFVVLHIASPYQLQYFYKYALARSQFTPRKALKLNKKALLKDLPYFVFFFVLCFL